MSDPDQAFPDFPETDALLSRVVDRVAAAEDFDVLLEAAADAPGPLRQLVLALRDDCALVAGVEEALGVADAMPAPAAPVAVLPRRTGWGAWSGWAAAMLVAACWAGSSARPGLGAFGVLPTVALREAGPAPASAGSLDAEGTGLDPAAGAVPPGTPDALRRPRLRIGPDTSAPGRVVGELPMQLVSTSREADGGGYEVVVLRRLLERTRVDSVLSLGADDAGRLAPVAVDPALLAQAASF